MHKWSPSGFKKRAARAYNRVGGPDVVKRREIATNFAKKHDLVYFHTVGAENDTAPIIRGSTSSPKQIDSNFCIGTHASYDMAIIERTADVEFIGFETTSHRWYVLEIDLKHTKHASYMFMGTRQLTRAFFAKVLVSHRDVRYLQLETVNPHATSFHGTYALVSSPTNQPVLHDIFSDDTLHMLATHKYPFTLEVEGDSLILFTEAEKPSEQLLDKLLHFGLWFARRLDETVD